MSITPFSTFLCSVLFVDVLSFEITIGKQELWAALRNFAD